MMILPYLYQKKWRHQGFLSGIKKHKGIMQFW